MGPPSVKRFSRRSPPRVKVVGGIRRNGIHGRRSILANSNQVDMLEKVKKILNKPTGYLPTDQAASEDDKSSSRLKVAVRVRPLNQNEMKAANPREIVVVAGPQMLVFDPPIDHQEFFFHNKKQKDITAKKFKDQKFAFDYVYDSGITNEEIYAGVISPLLSTLMTGVNCSVFAYGATGSGKTYTMLGTPNNPGLTFLAMNDLYQRLESASEQFDFQIVISYFEVYNEQVRDLLNHTGEQLQVREIGTGIDISNLSYHHPRDVNHLMEMLRIGNTHRSQHPTDHNAESSRSHALLQVQIQLRERYSSMNTTSRTAKLVMVDLAGSEKGAATGCSGQRFREGSSINKSLLALGNCISALASGKKFIQFRDSKLTRILKDSLGGNCKTVMVANVSPAEQLYDDTLNTLRYAEKAKKISCTTKKNVMTVQSCLSQYTRVVDEMAVKIETLETEAREKDECITQLREELARTLLEMEVLKRLPRGEQQQQQHPQGPQVGGPVSMQMLDQLKQCPPPLHSPASAHKQGITAMRAFFGVVKSDSLQKRQIRKAIENYTHRFELSSKRFNRYQSLYQSTGDARFEKAGKRAQKKMGLLAKKIELSLSKLTDLLGTKESQYTLQPSSVYTSYNDLWEDIKEVVPEGQIPESLRIPTEEGLTHLLKQKLAEELVAENGVTKSQLTNLMKRCDEKDEMLSDAVDLTSKLHSIVKHYQYDTPTLNERYENFVSSFCGSTVTFTDGDVDEDTEEDKLSETMTQESPEAGNELVCENPVQFYHSMMGRVTKALKSTDDTEAASLLETILKLQRDKADKLLSLRKPNREFLKEYEAQLTSPDAKVQEAIDMLHSAREETEKYFLTPSPPSNNPLDYIDEMTEHEEELKDQQQPSVIIQNVSLPSPPPESLLQAEAGVQFLAPPEFAVPLPPSFMTAPQRLNRMDMNTTVDLVYPDEEILEGSSNLNVTRTFSKLDGTFVLESAEEESRENLSPDEGSAMNCPPSTSQMPVASCSKSVGGNAGDGAGAGRKHVMEDALVPPKPSKQYKKTPHNFQKRMSPKLSSKPGKKVEVKAGRNQPATLKLPTKLGIPGPASASRMPRKSPSSSSVVTSKMSAFPTPIGHDRVSTEPIKMLELPGPGKRSVEDLRREGSDDAMA